MEIKQMEISLNTRRAYAEIDEFLGLLSEEQKNKIPQKLRDFFREEKDKDYIKGINPDIPIKDQNLKVETLGIIALLNLQYWCEDENEKQRLKEIYAKNEKEFQEMLQVSFNPDNIFLKKSPSVVQKQEQIENKQIVAYKKSIIKKILDRILKFFHLK